MKGRRLEELPGSLKSRKLFVNMENHSLFNLNFMKKHGK